MKTNNILKQLYSPLISKGAKYLNTSRRSAELIKYASNAFLATKITYINEIANMCEKLNVNVEDVSIGMGLDKRIGGRFLRAGPAYGGSCFPKDTRAILNTANQIKSNLSLIKTVIKSNENRSRILTARIFKILNGNLKNKKISFLGVTFKANTDDMRESSSIKIIPALSKKGALISYYDPTGEKKEFKKIKNVKFKPSIKSCCERSDLVIIHTEWNDFKSIDFRKIMKKNNFKLFDMRNIYSVEKMKKDKVKYFSIGR